jgi:hypothetical protein
MHESSFQSTQGQNNKLPQMLLLQNQAWVLFRHARDNIPKECDERSVQI